MSKKNNPLKPISPMSDFIESDNEENWLLLKLNNNSEDNEFIKVLSANVELSEIEFPRLFELNEDILPSILKKIILFGYNCYFPELIIENNSEKIEEINTKTDQK